MISQITGKIIHKAAPVVTIDVNGIGYEVHAPMNAFYSMAPLHSNITLITHLVIREDQHTLFGFTTHNERALFRYLIKVNGIGPKLALAILSSMDYHTFSLHIINKDINALVRIPGVGKKTAERLLIEMQNKIDEFATETNLPNQSITSSQALEDAIRALNALGYKPQEAKRAVQSVHKPDLASEQLIRLALQQITKG
jgi:holliday junction DNA helicase RuvA